MAEPQLARQDRSPAQALSSPVRCTLTWLPASESLAMKGIFLTNTGDKPLGYTTVKQGIAKDPSSHIVWHVYALILRADKNFEEALKCYRKAVSIEPVSSTEVLTIASP